MHPEPDAEPAWVAELLDGPPVPESSPARTVRGEFIRRVRRADLGEDEAAVLRAGLLALNGKLGSR